MFSSSLLLLACIITLGAAQLSAHPRPRSFYCSAGPMPEDPAGCFHLINQVMRETWTQQELYFSERSEGHAKLPFTEEMYGCQMGIFAYDENSGAEFILESYLPQLREMITVCFFQKRKIAWRRIWGIGSGVRIVISGPGPWASGPLVNLSNGTVESF